jgi:hypothetical protein
MPNFANDDRTYENSPDAPRRHFRVRDKTIDYTIPSLKSIIAPDSPPSVRKRQSPIVPARPRTTTNRNGQKSLLLTVRLSPAKLVGINARSPPAQRHVRLDPPRGQKRRVPDDEDRVEDREPAKPFGGILTKEDADTSKTTPTELDRSRFDRARDLALVHP